MTTIDPKVFFSNERTFLKWLHTSVTIGSVGSGLLGVSQLSPQLNEGDSNPIKGIALVLLAVSIFFCVHAIYTFRKRNSLLRLKSGEGYDNPAPPVILGTVIVLMLGVVYSVYLSHTTIIKV